MLFCSREKTNSVCSIRVDTILEYVFKRGKFMLESIDENGSGTFHVMKDGLVSCSNILFIGNVRILFSGVFLFLLVCMVFLPFFIAL